MTSNANSSPFPQAERHPKYYIKDADVHILAGDTLFCVHSYFLRRDSHVFSSMLDKPIAPNVPRKGSSDSNPIVIPDSTSPYEFAKFLWVFYNDTYSDYSATTSEWTSILKIACEFDFTEVKNCTIRGLQQCDLSLVERVHIYELYKVGLAHLIPLYAELCARDRGLDDGEIKHLGPESSLRIFRLRERVRSSEKGSRSPIPEGVDVLDALCKILKVDKDKVLSMSRGGYASGSVHRRPRTSTVAPTTSMPEGPPGHDSRRDVYVYGDYICQQPCNPIFLGTYSEADRIVEKEIPGYPEVGEEPSYFLSFGGLVPSPSCTDAYITYDLSLGAPLSLPPRTFLVLLAFCWTLAILWTI